MRSKKFFTVAAATAIAGAGLPAPVASAAPESAWDQVAACESGGDWHINTGNGYHGGLQFNPQTWAAHGGTQYAATADQATKAQQIEIAENVLANQGAGAWPNCGGPVAG
ncbi:transglycosylase family protein [Corynebacterium camporealensis]|uniref:transglycosylase family protein n=1 Tax=Corynebacterium camporealensis TaxID=161896 RepID=UPI0034CD41BE